MLQLGFLFFVGFVFIVKDLRFNSNDLVLDVLFWYFALFFRIYGRVRVIS